MVKDLGTYRDNSVYVFTFLLLNLITFIITYLDFCLLHLCKYPQLPELNTPTPGRGQNSPEENIPGNTVQEQPSLPRNFLHEHRLWAAGG